jgi:hypothetical protein
MFMFIRNYSCNGLDEYRAVQLWCHPLRVLPSPKMSVHAFLHFKKGVDSMKRAS